MSRWRCAWGAWDANYESKVARVGACWRMVLAPSFVTRLTFVRAFGVMVPGAENCFGDSGAAALAPVLAQMTGLTQLRLGSEWIVPTWV